MSTKTSLSEGKGWHIFFDETETKEMFSGEIDHVWIEIDDTYWRGDSGGEIRVLLTRDMLNEMILGFFDIHAGNRLVSEVSDMIKNHLSELEVKESEHEQG